MKTRVSQFWLEASLSPVLPCLRTLNLRNLLFSFLLGVFWVSFDDLRHCNVSPSEGKCLRRSVNSVGPVSQIPSMFIYVDCGTLKNPHTIRKEQGMKFPVLWLSFVSLWAWAGAEKGICLAWDLVSRSHITLALRCKSCQKQYACIVRLKTATSLTTARKI